jgi:hypothetical protein
MAATREVTIAENRLLLPCGAVRAVCEDLKRFLALLIGCSAEETIGKPGRYAGAHVPPP